MGGNKSVSERLDLLLVKILKLVNQYIQKKEEFLEVYRDGFFDLTTSGLNKNSNSISHFDTEAEFFPLYKVIIENDEFSIQKTKSSEKTMNTKQTLKTQNVDDFKKKDSDDNEIRQRNATTQQQPSEEWVEDDSAEVAFEGKLIEMKKDPLFILSPIPTKNQRAAQKTLQKSLSLLTQVCTMKRAIDVLVEEYEELSKLDHL